MRKRPDNSPITVGTDYVEHDCYEVGCYKDLTIAGSYHLSAHNAGGNILVMTTGDEITFTTKVICE